jgi:putative ABC transport system permease protein
MIKNYLKTALRFLVKNKTFSFINIFGLTMGTLCCLYIVLYVTDQYSYDTQHNDVKDIFRIGKHMLSKAQGHEADVPTTVAPVAPLMKKDFAEVKQFTRVVPFLGVDKHVLHYNNKDFYEKDAVYVDSTFFEVFNYHFVNGNASKALAEPYSIVLLKSVADKLFGKEDPIDKTITIENVFNKKDYTVKGVVDESKGKSHIHATIFITMNSGGIGDYILHTDSWIKNGYVSSYVKLQANADIALLEKKFPAFINRYASEQLKNAGVEEQIYLQPVTAIHTTTGLEGYQLTKPVSPAFLTILLLIATLIQVIACINFMNLSTARASKRAKEVGVRKVIGAGRKDLVKQFLGESFLLSLTGVLIALPLLLALLPYLNQITQADIKSSFLKDINVWLMLAALVTATSLVAGSYPAFYLSAFRTIKVIKGNFTSHISAAGLRRSLVVFQFVLSILLITSIIIIYSQLNYIKNKDLGFEKEQRLIFSFNTSDAIAHVPAFMDGLRQLAEVKGVSNASTYLSSPEFYSNGFFLRGQKDADAKTTNFIVSDEYFVKANGIKLLTGRDFRSTDSSKVLINETYAKQLGLDPLAAIGTLLYDNQFRTVEVVGVMKDFNYSTLHKNVEGFLIWMLRPHNNIWPAVIVNTNTANYKDLLAKIESIWHKNISGVPFSYAFLDEAVQKQYESEISLSRIINSFTLMAILISCLGLFGLAAFSAEQRSKEISVRKVLGASVPGIARLLSKDFLKLVIIAFVIATPIAWWTMNKWLQIFANKITLSWWMFALAGVLAVFIALLTVWFQAIKAAIANPVKSLRTE